MYADVSTCRGNGTVEDGKAIGCATVGGGAAAAAAAAITGASASGRNPALALIVLPENEIDTESRRVRGGAGAATCGAWSGITASAGGGATAAANSIAGSNNGATKDVGSAVTFLRYCAGRNQTEPNTAQLKYAISAQPVQPRSECLALESAGRLNENGESMSKYVACDGAAGRILRRSHREKRRNNSNASAIEVSRTHARMNLRNLSSCRTMCWHCDQRAASCGCDCNCCHMSALGENSLLRLSSSETAGALLSRDGAATRPVGSNSAGKEAAERCERTTATARVCASGWRAT